MNTSASRSHFHGIWDRQGRYHYHPGWQRDCRRYPCSTSPEKES